MRGGLTRYRDKSSTRRLTSGEASRQGGVMTSSTQPTTGRPSTAPVETFCAGGRWVVRSADVVLGEFGSRSAAVDAAHSAALALRTDSVIRYAVPRRGAADAPVTSVA